MSYLPSNQFRSGEGYSGGYLFVKIRTWVLQGSKLLLSAIKSNAELAETRINVSKREHEVDGIEYLQGLGYLEVWSETATDHYANFSNCGGIYQ